MFTGIIAETGVVTRASRSGVSIRASSALLGKLRTGTSIAVDGACLTIVSKSRNSFATDIMPETAERTTLGKLRKGDIVNLELPATPTSFLSGHIVQGHVDGTGVVKDVAVRGMSRMLTIRIPRALTRFVVRKGSIALNGVSLTVFNVRRSDFTVGVIPHTLKTTTLRTLSRGATVNIETDILAKHVQKSI